MRTWEMGRIVWTAVVIWGLAVPTPIAWAQIDGGWGAVDTLVHEQLSTTPELEQIATELVAECQTNEQLAASVETEAVAIQEATRTTEAAVTTVASDPNAVVATLQSQGLTVSSDAVTKLTEAAAAVSKALQEGAVVTDERVERQLVALKEAFEAMAKSAGLSEASEMERFFAGGPPGSEGGSFREMAFLADCARSGDALRTHFETEMTKYAEVRGAPPSEFLAQIAMSGYNVSEMMHTVATEMAMAAGPPSEAMVADAQAKLGEYLSNPAISAEDKALAQQRFNEWSSGQMPTGGFSGPGMESMMAAAGSVEAWARDPNTITHAGSGWENVTVGWTPEGMAGVYSAYEGGWTAGGSWTPAEGAMWTHEGYAGLVSTTYDHPTTTTTEYQQQQQQTQTEQQVQQQAEHTHTLVSTHTVENDGHAEGHWDGNGDGIADHTHPVGTMPH